MTTEERLKLAQWILERNIAWNASGDSKVAAIVAGDAAMAAGLASAFALESANRSTVALLACTVAALLIVGSVFCAAMALFPRTKAPNQSLVYFGTIGRMAASDYVERLRQVAVADALEDLGIQIHRNAQIAQSKYQWIGVSLRSGFIAVVPWAAAIICLIR